MSSTDSLLSMRNISPSRKSSKASNITELANEQLLHFGINPASDFGQSLQLIASNIYHAAGNIDELTRITKTTLSELPRADQNSYFNAKKFLCFQLAKLINDLQPSLRLSYKQLGFHNSTQLAKGDYPLFANVGTLFSSSPAITRTATYIYACTEWIDDAFHGKENTHPIYSRLLNPTSMALSNTIVELEAGPYSSDYLAWNFNSGMAAIDAILSNQLKRNDILIVSRNIYGGSHQLLHDYFAREDRLNIKLAWFNGYSSNEFNTFLKATQEKYASNIDSGSSLHIYIESPCNPHGYTLDIENICRLSHKNNYTVILDSTLATPILNKPLQRDNKEERPDYVIHSYTKDLSGTGNTTAGVVIGEHYKMFIPKGTQCNGFKWEDTLFWDTYYIKGAFLDADKAAEVLSGMKTLENRMLSKCINTLIFTNYLNSNPAISVNSHSLEGHPNAQLRKKNLYLGLPCPLFSIDFEKANLSRQAFIRFFDSLAPTFGHMVSLGQNDTLMLCPALTSHSELSSSALKDAEIYPTTIRIAMGGENPRDLIYHFKESAKQHLNSDNNQFSCKFMNDKALDNLIISTTLDVYKRHLEHQIK